MSSNIDKFKENMKLLYQGKSGGKSSVSESKIHTLQNKEKVYEDMGKLEPRKIKVIKKPNKKTVTVQKSLQQLSNEGNADEIIKRFK